MQSCEHTLSRTCHIAECITKNRCLRAPINTLDARNGFIMAMSHYYKIELDRAERCLADIIEIIGNEHAEFKQVEFKQVEQILERLTAYYSRADSVQQNGTN